MDNSALELILPDGMLGYFDVTGFKKSASDYTIHLAEKSLFPTEFDGQKLVSKGFLMKLLLVIFLSVAKPVT